MVKLFLSTEIISPGFPLESMISHSAILYSLSKRLKYVSGSGDKALI